VGEFSPRQEAEEEPPSRGEIAAGATVFAVLYGDRAGRAQRLDN
jgi:hypothetical protein